MELRNARGTAVDPVPFLVVDALAFTVCYSYAPIYFVALGWSLPAALVITTGAFLVVTAAAFHQLVWTSYPGIRAEVPVGYRIRRLFMASIICVVALFGLSLPLLVGS